jgi:hypothetical protein
VKVYRYPPGKLMGDYVRAGVGLSVGLGVLATVPASPAIVVVFGGISALFGVFGLRTVKRHMTEVSVGEAGIRADGLGTVILSWPDLDFLRLRYYGTRRQRTRGEGEGFMQLTLRGGGAKLTLESSVEGFEYITWRAAKAARDKGLSLDPASAGNLLNLGIDADVEQPPPEP